MRRSFRLNGDGREVLLAYLDESYSASRYYIAALVVPEGQARSLSAALDGVVDRAAAAYPGLTRRAELHGHELFQAKGDWRPLSGMARARIGLYKAALEAVAAHDVKVIIEGVDVPRLRQRYIWPDPPHKVVLSHLLERVDEYADRHDAWALVIADEVDDQHTHRSSLRHFQRYATQGYRARQLVRIVDTLHFVPSDASRLVQATDLIAFLHHRVRVHTDEDERARRANLQLYSLIEACCVHVRTWFP